MKPYTTKGGVNNRRIGAYERLKKEKDALSKHVIAVKDAKDRIKAAKVGPEKEAVAKILKPIADGLTDNILEELQKKESRISKEMSILKSRITNYSFPE